MAAITNPASTTLAISASSGWVYMGDKWGYSPGMGTAGGQVYWSFADLDLSSALAKIFLEYPTMNTPLTQWEREEVRTAFDTWEKVSNIDFVEVPDSAAANIRFGKTYIDGYGCTLGETTVWPNSTLATIREVSIVIDTADQAVPTDALSTPLGFLSTAAHEIGHAIGLDHSANPNAIMYPYYNGMTRLSSEDIAGIQAIYGVAPTTSSTSTATSTSPLSAAQYSHEASIIRLYLAAFDRAPDTTGKQYWTSEMDEGVTLQTIADAFCLSPEFAARYGTTVSSTEFLDHVYQNVLGRSGDAEGTAYWLNELNHGRSRGEVLVGFSESSEHILQNAAYIDGAVSGAVTAMLTGVATTTDIAPYPWL